MKHLSRPTHTHTQREGHGGSPYRCSWLSQNGPTILSFIIVTAKMKRRAGSTESSRYKKRTIGRLTIDAMASVLRRLPPRWLAISTIRCRWAMSSVARGNPKLMTDEPVDRNTVTVEAAQARNAAHNLSETETFDVRALAERGRASWELGVIDSFLGNEHLRWSPDTPSDARRRFPIKSKGCAIDRLQVADASTVRAPLFVLRRGALGLFAFLRIVPGD